MAAYAEQSSSAQGGLGFGGGGGLLEPNRNSALQPPPGDRPVTGSSGKLSFSSSNEQRPAYASPPSRARSSNTATEDNKAARREVRTLPPWVASFEDDDIDDSDPTKQLLPTYPGNIQFARHNHTPAPAIKHTGKLHDADRDPTAVPICSPVREQASRWHTFAKVSAFVPTRTEERRIVDDAWLEQHGGDFRSPWGTVQSNGDGEEGKEHSFLKNKTKRRVWYVRAQRTLLRNPIIPLVFRLIIWFFSLIALALGGSILHLSNKDGFSQRPSTLMAIIVDTIALVYIFYVTYDEYTGKPLGLRSPKAKMRLILLDLFFIVFDSANLSLAFDALSDPRWSCKDEIESNGHIASGSNQPLCDRQRALSSVLLVALVAWIMTFAISVLRVVERVTRT